MPTITAINRKKRKKRQRRKLRNKFKVDNVAAIKAELELKPPPFYIDKTPSKVLTKKDKKEFYREQKLHSEVASDPYPHIKPTSTKRKRNSETYSEYVEKLTKKYKNSPLIKDKIEEEKKQKKRKSYIFPRRETTDIWKSTTSQTPQPTEESKAEEQRMKSFLEEAKPIQKKKYIPSHRNAFEKPHPGESYNPTLQHYLKLLQIAVERYRKEERKMKKIEKFLKAEKLPNRWYRAKEFDQYFFDRKIEEANERNKEDDEDEDDPITALFKQEKREKELAEEQEAEEGEVYSEYDTASEVYSDYDTASEVYSEDDTASEVYSEGAKEDTLSEMDQDGVQSEPEIMIDHETDTDSNVGYDTSEFNNTDLEDEIDHSDKEDFALSDNEHDNATDLDDTNISSDEKEIVLNKSDSTHELSSPVQPSQTTQQLESNTQESFEDHPEEKPITKKLKRSQSEKTISTKKLKRSQSEKTISTKSKSPSKLHRSKSEQSLHKSEKDLKQPENNQVEPVKKKRQRGGPVPKTQTQRNKEKRRRIREAILRRKEVAKRRNAAWDRISQIRAKLDRYYKKKKIREEEIAKYKEINRLYGIKQLGSTKFEEADVQVLLPGELPDRLSRLAYTGPTIWDDRLKSFQKRNIIEVRKHKTQKLKYRKHYVERYDYKIFNRQQETTYKDLNFKEEPELFFPK